MMTGLKLAHWLGLAMVMVGLGIYGLTSWAEQMQGILLVSSLLGLGLVMMSPFPIVLFIQWAKAQDQTQAETQQDNQG
ncbi:MULTISPECIES: hypothetical protein [Shewanella]|uniref:hypothetical protein n=1 Tax=Shewanella TaxID=22 RepID=UPI001EFC6732|nr:MULTISPECIES: hypothetical protein [Shewanella]MCG9747645.1 hypothetical protein [Shewanella sp. Isolate8]MCL2909044.1 hypothetical protein [Shewanella aquimarina]